MSINYRVGAGLRTYKITMPKHKDETTLTQRQENFCLNLFKGMTQREAWINAGYSSNYDIGNVDRNACILAGQTKIKKRLAELRKPVSDALINEKIASERERSERLTEFIRANVVDFISEDGEVSLKGKPNLGAIAEYEIKPTKYGYRKSLKLLNPIQAITELNRMEHIYETRPTLEDNRVTNIIVLDNETKDLIAKVKERTGKLIEGEVNAPE